MTNYKFKRFHAFTLAEVLITLGIIGVVAAITIPTLASNYKQRAWDTAANVFEKKLEESLKTMNTQQTLTGYSNTADFVSELSKHFKITRICENDNLLACFEDKVWWGAGDVKPKEFDINDIKTAANFGQNNWDTNIIGVQFVNGTTGLVAYNPNCTQNPYSNQIKGTSCLAMLYDTNGFKTPNTSGKDLRGINISRLGEACTFELGGTCFGSPFMPTSITKNECEALKSTLGIKECYYENDYWAGAVKTCGGVDNLPTQSQIANIATYIYGKNINLSGTTYGNINEEKASELGIIFSSGDPFYIWSGEEPPDSKYAYTRGFMTDRTDWAYTSRSFNIQQTMCILQ